MSNWSGLRSLVTVGRLSHVAMKAGSLVDRNLSSSLTTARPCRLHQKDRLTNSRSRGDRAEYLRIPNSEKKPPTRIPGLSTTPRATPPAAAYKVPSWNPASEVGLRGNDEWVGGKLPPLQKIIWRTIPSAGQPPPRLMDAAMPTSPSTSRARTPRR